MSSVYAQETLNCIGECSPVTCQTFRIGCPRKKWEKQRNVATSTSEEDKLDCSSQQQEKWFLPAVISFAFMIFRLGIKTVVHAENAAPLVKTTTIHRICYVTIQKYLLILFSFIPRKIQGIVPFWLRTNAWEFEEVPETLREVDVRQRYESGVIYHLPEIFLNWGNYGGTRYQSRYLKIPEIYFNFQTWRSNSNAFEHC